MKKIKYKFAVIDKVIGEEDDGGCAKIATLADPNDKSFEGCFFRFQSWSEDGSDHELFECFEGRKVRVTIETIDEDEPTKEILGDGKCDHCGVYTRQTGKYVGKKWTCKDCDK